MSTMAPTELCLRIGLTSWIKLVGPVDMTLGQKSFKKSTGAVHMVVLSSEDCSDDQLIDNLRSSFSDAPTMNMAKEGIEEHETEGK